jgi:hypothetical protein
MIRKIIVVMLLLAGAVAAGPPKRELTAAVALRLIEMRHASLPWSDRPVSADARVAGIQEGTSDEGRFRKTHVRRVTTVEGVLEKGSRVRRVVCRDFQWSDEYGWHFSEIREERGGDAVWIWSESQGQVIIR